MVYSKKLVLLFLITSLTSAAYIQEMNMLQAGSSPEQMVAYRLFIRDNNQKQVQKINSQGKSFTLEAYPQFSKYTIEEIAHLYSNKQMGKFQINSVQLIAPRNRFSQPNVAYILRNSSNIIVNNTFETGTPKNQGKCGGCYSFAANSIVNYAVNIFYSPYDPKTGALKLASEQEIIECSFGQRNIGCDGGWPHQAMLYIKKYGVLSDKKYKYRLESYNNGVIKPCQVTKSTIKDITIDRSSIKLGSDVSVLDMISVIDRFKVAAIGVYSSSFNFIYYKNGTLNNCGPQLPIDHAATAVGYIINQNKSEYAWIIKNSWGVKWGMNGHIQLGMCVPLSYVSFLSTQA